MPEMGMKPLVGTAHDDARPVGKSHMQLPFLRTQIGVANSWDTDDTETDSEMTIQYAIHELSRTTAKKEHSNPPNGVHKLWNGVTTCRPTVA